MKLEAKVSKLILAAKEDQIRQVRYIEVFMSSGTGLNDHLSMKTIPNEKFMR